MWNLKGDDTNELIKQIQPHRFREQIFGCRGKEEDGIKDT